MRELLDELIGLRNRYAAHETRRKAELLGQVDVTRANTARDVRRLHDVLLFLIAHPDSRRIYRVATDLLEQLSDRLVRDPSLTRARRGLAGSGIAGTRVTGTFTIDAARWLCNRHEQNVGIDWSDDEAADRVERLLPLLTWPVEREGLRCPDYTTEDWFRLAVGNSPSDHLRWLIGRIDDRVAGEALRDRVFDELDLTLYWNLSMASDGRSGSRLRPRNAYTFEKGMIRSFDLPAILREPIPRAQVLGVRAASQVIDSVRASLFSRLRETDAVTYANPHEVTRFQIQRGVDLYLFGLLPERRLAVESFFGYIIARNSIPAGYGGGWVFLDRCEIGTNVFDEFRGGESAWLFAHVLRVYQQYFNVSLFQVEPYQIGEGNSEAIRTGAFWFYYRLGFRPVDDGLRVLADKEWKRLQRKGAERTAAKTLRKLGGRPVVMRVGGERLISTPAPPLTDLGIAITRGAQRQWGLDRKRVERGASRHIAGVLGVDLRSASPAQRLWFDRLAILFAPLPGLDEWSRADRKHLSRAMLAKGGPRERAYATGLQKIPRLGESLEALTQAGAT